MPPFRIFAPDYRPNEIRPKRAKRQKGEWFAQGELMRLCLETVRKASDPITAKEVALAIMQQKGCDASDEAGYTPGEWTFSLGAGAGFAPDYEGSEN